jgi:hypothetical protein
MLKKDVLDATWTRSVRVVFQSPFDLQDVTDALLQLVDLGKDRLGQARRVGRT